MTLHVIVDSVLLLTTVALIAAGLASLGASGRGPDRHFGRLRCSPRLGCPGTGTCGCAATVMAPGSGSTYGLTVTVPAGSYELKVAINGSWDESYGSESGGNIPLVIQGRPSWPSGMTTSATGSPSPRRSSPARRPTRTQPSPVTALRTGLTRERVLLPHGRPLRQWVGNQQHRGSPVVGSTPVRPHRHRASTHGGDLRGVLNRLD